MLTISEILDLIQSGKINESNLDSKDLMKIQFYTEKLNEEVYKNYITAYHRTRDINEFLDESNKHGFRLGGGEGAMYGVGLYGNYTWEGVHSQYSMRTYGNYVVKYIVKPNNILFFDESTQIKIYGKPMSLVEQCDYWGIKIDSKMRRNIEITFSLDFMSDKNGITSKSARIFVEQVLFEDGVDEPRIIPDIYGISYNGHNDQDTILMYDFRNISIVGWYDESDGIKDKKDMIPLNKTHNYYNQVNVSKEVLKNISKTQEVKKSQDEYITINGKLFSKDILSHYNIQNMPKKHKKNLYHALTKNLSDSEQLKYFIKLFFYDKEDRIQVNDKNEIITSDYERMIFSIYDISLDFIPFKIQDNKMVNIDISDSDIKDLRNIPNVVQYEMSLSNLEKLVSLKGLENLKFSKENPLNIISLHKLPKITTLDYLPDNTPYSLSIYECKGIDFNKVNFPSSIVALNFVNFDIRLREFDLNVLNKLSNLEKVSINHATLQKINNQWVFPEKYKTSDAYYW